MIRPTGAGRAAFADLEARQNEQTGKLLAGLAEAGRRRLVDAMRAIREVLPGPDHGDGPAARPPGGTDLVTFAVARRRRRYRA